ncbi:hypothetical protein CVIRNUC_006130 [Coccomyxa viridis]|uniref:PRISE-like Rossmann-fold domain-containing protein n=1 Tax=Coccomyxa viridis TaxID=1274662 RepID=A0AAV1I8U3_9CHLO|nr:hypothetical protein CVIRNUC_006130 [Coccomyxa viridis]
MKRVDQGAKWTWSALRPGAIIGFSLGYMNLLDFFGVYGTICKETGAAFRYPGLPKTYRVLMDCVDVDLLTACQIYLSTHPTAQNTAYNISNGDVFRFEQLWPALADWFGVEVAPPLKIPLTTFMPQHKELWSRIRQKYHLKDYPYDKLHQADFAEAWLSFPTDAFADCTKLRKAGFELSMWSEECLISKLNELAREKAIPDYPALKKGAAEIA